MFLIICRQQFEHNAVVTIGYPSPVRQVVVALIVALVSVGCLLLGQLRWCLLLGSVHELGGTHGLQALVMPDLSAFTELQEAAASGLCNKS